jgi:hypothetical protein
MLLATVAKLETFGSNILLPINKMIIGQYTSFRTQDQVTMEAGLPTVQYSRCHSLRRIWSAAQYNEHNPVKLMPVGSTLQLHTVSPSALQAGVVSFKPQPLYSWFLLNRRLGGPQTRPGRFRENKNLLLLRGIKSQTVQPVA